MSCKAVTIRRYRESDFEGAARLVRNLFTKFVIPDASPKGVDFWSGYLSLRRSNRETLKRRYSLETIAFVALAHGRIVGLVMGTIEELKRLFVKEGYHGMGIGRQLMSRFEQECVRHGATRFKITASLHAASFYTRMGCKKTTGIRNLHGLKVQPMKKILRQRGNR